VPVADEADEAVPVADVAVPVADEAVPVAAGAGRMSVTNTIIALMKLNETNCS
jgi:hypothetical protein